jgi:hypothetical protein
MSDGANQWGGIASKAKGLERVEAVSLTSNRAPALQLQVEVQEIINCEFSISN